MNWRGLIDTAQHPWRAALESAALILSVVNGFALFRSYLRDRPKLLIEVVHPEVYQWWFPLPGQKAPDGTTSRAYGFFLYVGIANAGLRKVQINSWRLSLKNRPGKRQVLKPLNMPEIEFTLGGPRKVLPVLGQRGPYFDGEALVDAGCSISGTAFYVYECYGGEGWDPVRTGDKISATFGITDVFGGRASARILFSARTLQDLSKTAPDIGQLEQIAMSER